MKHLVVIIFLVLVSINKGLSQTNKISIEGNLNTTTHTLEIDQKITYYNNSNSDIETIVFHNWPNSFKNRDTDLSKRLVEEFKKSLYFADSSEIGYTNIKQFQINNKTVNYTNYNQKIDIIEACLENKLAPKDSLEIHVTYNVKIPKNEYTGYGRSPEGQYNLRFWYLVPAVFENKEWKAYSNVNTDYMYMDPANYRIKMKVPIGFHINSSLRASSRFKNDVTIFNIRGNKRVDVQLNITKDKSFTKYQTDKVTVYSNIETENLSYGIRKTIINRGIDFIETYLGKYPHKEIMVDNESYKKEIIYGLINEPAFLAPYSGVFEWDIRFFKTLTQKYIDNTLLVNKNNDYWLTDGIQIYLLMEYAQKYYPEVTLIGKYSNIPGLDKTHLSKLKFEDKYPFMYTFYARRNLDQPLTTPRDSLTKMNRRYISKYKAALGLRYLNKYLGDEVLQKSVLKYYRTSRLKRSNSKKFEEIVTKHTKKDTDWFFKDYLETNKKIDYSIKKVEETKDSLSVTIKNKRNFTAPVAVYGVNDKDIVWKEWVTDIDSTKTITVAKGDFNKISLNYRHVFPESNSRNNWKNLNSNLIERPIQLKPLTDINNPYYNQIFYTPSINYNAYDGLILGISFSNIQLLKNNFEYKITPTYSTLNGTFTGKFKMDYNYYPEDKGFYSLKLGVSGSNFHYAEDLAYNSLNPYIKLNFNRKNPRVIEKNTLTLKYIMVDKEIPNGAIISEEDKYSLLKLDYTYSKPHLIKNFNFNTNIEYEKNFAKIATEFQYRELCEGDRQLDLRIYAGAFLYNNTDLTSTYFNFGLSQVTDYLFEYNLFARSDDSGFLSQQYVYAQGGFKSIYDTEYSSANQWMTTANGSMTLWKSIEAYADIGLIKNRNRSVKLAYDSGIRFNFLYKVLELYLPVYSNIGWEFNQENYASKIRFVFTLEPSKIYNYLRTSGKRLNLK